MLPKAHRLHRSEDFHAVMRGGVKKGRRLVVVHLFRDDSSVRSGGPRFGLIVSKAVGNSVVRHRVSRRLRHICWSMVGELPADARVVIRALPRCAEANAAALESDVKSAVRQLRDGVFAEVVAPCHSEGAELHGT